MKTKYARTDSVLFVIYGSNNLIGYYSLFYFTLLLESLGEITMGEALIWYRKRGGVDPELLKPTVITINTNYNVPITGNYRVFTVGGGGGGAGSCRNAWNTSQVMYGPGGGRGSLSDANVNLNQGDSVVCTIGSGGSGGTNNTSPLSYSNGQVNSAGGSGYAGGTTSFGSYGSGAGGSGGLYPWYNKYWSNVNRGWVNTITSWTWQNTYNNRTWYFRYSLPSGANYWYRYDITGAMPSSDANNIMATYPNATAAKWVYTQLKIVWQNLYGYTRSGSYLGSPQLLYRSENQSYMGMSGWYNFTANHVEASSHDDFQFGYHHSINTIYQINNTWNFAIRARVPVWSNRVNWQNRIYNSTGRCYTSIQQGTWWYLNNNTVSTSGSRAYNGDGGNSGQKGNSGFILIIPPQQ